MSVYKADSDSKIYLLIITIIFIIRYSLYNAFMFILREERIDK